MACAYSDILCSWNACLVLQATGCMCTCIPIFQASPEHQRASAAYWEACSEDALTGGIVLNCSATWTLSIGKFCCAASS